MTHTFDSKVSLHSWLLWPTVRCAMAHPSPHGCAAPLPQTTPRQACAGVLLRPLVSEASLTTKPADDKSKKDIIIRSAPYTHSITFGQ